VKILIVSLAMLMVGLMASEAEAPAGLTLHQRVTDYATGQPVVCGSQTSTSSVRVFLSLTGVGQATGAVFNTVLRDGSQLWWQRTPMNSQPVVNSIQVAEYVQFLTAGDWYFRSNYSGLGPSGDQVCELRR